MLANILYIRTIRYTAFICDGRNCRVVLRGSYRRRGPFIRLLVNWIWSVFMIRDLSDNLTSRGMVHMGSNLMEILQSLRNIATKIIFDICVL